MFFRGPLCTRTAHACLHALLTRWLRLQSQMTYFVDAVAVALLRYVTRRRRSQRAAHARLRRQGREEPRGPATIPHVALQEHCGAYVRGCGIPLLCAFTSLRDTSRRDDVRTRDCVFYVFSPACTCCPCHEFLSMRSLVPSSALLRKPVCIKWHGAGAPTSSRSRIDGG